MSVIVEETAVEEDNLSDVPIEPKEKPKNSVVVRRAKKPKKRSISRGTYEVEIIPATIGVTAEGTDSPVKKVAAYCRVSTEQEAQASSYELQVRHYTEYIGSREGWILAGIYADEGISGTQTKHREQFLQMIEDCKAKKIDMVLTKSISRFSRNVVDCLTNVRMLKNLNPPVEVYFEKERLSSLDDKTDMILSLMASIAQEESRSISANISWAIRNRMKDGTQKIPTACLLGYESDEDGNLVIIEEEAKTVKFIYKNFVGGMHPNLIANKLNHDKITTVLGNPWTSTSIKGILRNEKYCGDVLMQKTFTVDYLTHKSKKNEGEREQFYIADHHDAIVSREIWDKAQVILDKMNYRNWKQRSQQRLIPLVSGILKGYISICHLWKDVNIVRLEAATQKVMNGEGGQMVELVKNVLENEERKEEVMADILKGFEVVDIEIGRSDSVMTVMGNMIKFNKPTAAELLFPEHVRMLINVPEKKVAIQACSEKTKNAVGFSKSEDKQNYAITIKIPALVVAIRKLLPDFDGTNALTFEGKLFADDKTIIYDLSKGTEIKRREYKKRKKTTVDEI